MMADWVIFEKLFKNSVFFSRIAFGEDTRPRRLTRGLVSSPATFFSPITAYEPF